MLVLGPNLAPRGARFGPRTASGAKRRSTLGDIVEFVIIAGLSGAGRSSVADNLEDLGWFVIDNLPPELMEKVAELASQPGSGYERVGLVVGSGTDTDEVMAAIGRLQRLAERVQIVFLDASTDALVRRYEATRRRHPLEAGEGLAAAIEQERVVLGPVRDEAEQVIDTSDLNVHQLRDTVHELFAGEDRPAMQVAVQSFGYKNGLPLDVDLVFDCRFLPNPHWVDELRPLTGRDQPVRNYVLDQPATQTFLTQLQTMLATLLPAYEKEGKSYLTVSFGCTGGRHRSVVIAETIAEWLRGRGLQPSVSHRDIDR